MAERTLTLTSLDILCHFEAYAYLYICCIFSDHVADIIPELFPQNKYTTNI